MTHGGKEYGYVTSGSLGVRVGFEEYELRPGGSIAFDSSSPHRLWAVGAEPVHAVWVVIGALVVIAVIFLWPSAGPRLSSTPSRSSRG